MDNDTSTISKNKVKPSMTMDYQSLIDMCSKKLEQDPYHKKALLLRASSLIKKGELNLALVDGLKLIELDKKNSASFYLLGCIYEKMGNVRLLLYIVLLLTKNHTY